DGGNGGDGGDVILRARTNQDSLVAFRYKKLLHAPAGKPGSKTKKHGKSGEDLEVPVPVGTVVLDDKAQILADLTHDNQTYTIASGGKGGFGNAHFVSSTRQAPRVAEKGEKGDKVEAVLELKMIADVGIVGLPNAGKSTLLSVISNARPEIADYPFTTLSPNLGVVDIDGKSLLFADIPGLIEGASQGKGLGDEFLRHVERTRVLVHLVDVYVDDVARAYKTIIKELADYQVDLSKRPQIVALTKTEGISKKELDALIKKLKKAVPRGTLVLAISSQSRVGVDELLRAVWQKVTQEKKKSAKKPRRPRLPVIKFKPSADDWQARTVKGGYQVTGKKIERFAQRTRFGDPHAEQRLRDIMRKMGIMRELDRLGLEPGQTIVIGSPQIGAIDY
ncbi:MAG TPA: GTPase ObgE, partial [Nitrososphaera sp.]|nr:GTPase ObgE [Nitrososphaera sp.]